MDILSIKLMNEQEALEFDKKISAPTQVKRERSLKYCVDNKEKILDYHDQWYGIGITKAYKSELLWWNKSNNESNSINNLINDVRNNIEHHCCCGGKLRWVEGHNFVGCSNYRTGSFGHDTYNYRNLIEIVSQEKFAETYDFPKMYLNELRHYFGISDVVQSKVLAEFLFVVNNEKPLSSEFSMDQFDGYQKTKGKSIKQELEIKLILEKKFTKVLPQPHIQYYTKDGRFVKIPDFICSNNDHVYVFDAKISSESSNIHQLNEYHEIVLALMDRLGIKKPIKSFQIFYSDTNLSDTEKNINRGLTLTDLQNEF